MQMAFGRRWTEEGTDKRTSSISYEESELSYPILFLPRFPPNAHGRRRKRRRSLLLPPKGATTPSCSSSFGGGGERSHDDASLSLLLCLLLSASSSCYSHTVEESRTITEREEEVTPRITMEEKPFSLRASSLVWERVCRPALLILTPARQTVIKKRRLWLWLWRSISQTR